MLYANRPVPADLSQGGTHAMLPRLVILLTWSLCITCSRAGVPDPCSLTVDVTTMDLACSNNVNGIADLELTGTNGTENVTWNDLNPEAFVVGDVAFGLAEGDYSVTVSNSVCSTTVAFSITSLYEIVQFDVGSTPADCGMSNGVITISNIVNVPAEGMQDILVNGVPTGSVASNLAPGAYLVEVGWLPVPGRSVPPLTCSSTQVVIVGEDCPCELSISVDVSHATCPDAGNGFAVLSLSGSNGTESLRYSNLNPEAIIGSEAVFSLSTGTFYVTVSNSICSTTVSFVVTALYGNVEFDALPVSAGCDTNNGSILITNIAGLAPFLDPEVYINDVFVGDGPTLIADVPPGDYTVRVIAVESGGARGGQFFEGCASTQVVTVTETGCVCTLSTSVDVTHAFCPDSVGRAALMIFGTNGDETVTWDLPSNAVVLGDTAFNVATGTWSVMVSNADDCVTTLSFTVTSSYDRVSFDVMPTPADCGQSNGSLQVTNIMTPTVPDEILILRVDGESLAPGVFEVSGLAAGMYLVEVGIAFGFARADDIPPECVSSQWVEITEMGSLPELSCPGPIQLSCGADLPSLDQILALVVVSNGSVRVDEGGTSIQTAGCLTTWTIAVGASNACGVASNLCQIEVRLPTSGLELSPAVDIRLPHTELECGEMPPSEAAQKELFRDLLLAGPVNESLIVFGDSLSDMGNLSIITGGAQPPAGYFPGRFSTGPTYIEHVFGSAVAGTAHASWNPADNNRASVYAVAGARTDSVGGLNDQVNLYLNDLAATATLPSGAHLIWIGGNDLRDALVSGDPVVAGGIISNALGSIISNISKLALAGADNFLLLNAPPLHQTPGVIAQNNPLVTGFAAALTESFNSGLAASLALLPPGLTLQTLDVPSLFDQAIADAPSLGITNVTEGAFLVGAVDPDAYFFTDELHPTAPVHAYVGQIVSAELSALLEVDPATAPCMVTSCTVAVVGTDEICAPAWTYTYEARSLCGDVVRHVQTFTTAADTNPPSLTASNIDVNACTYRVPAASNLVTVSDNCTGVSLRVNPVPGSILAALTNMLTVIATDDCGNESTRSVTVRLNCAYTISGYKFEDRNKNGELDCGDGPARTDGGCEPGLAGVTIYIDENANGQFDPGEAHVMTDTFGYYRFENIAPGSYIVGAILPTGTMATTPTLQTVTVTTENVVDVNFGCMPVIEQICAFVWNDLNNSGTVAGEDPIENSLISNAMVQLSRVVGGVTTVVSNAVSDAMGEVCFRNLTPGIYCMQIVNVEALGYDVVTTTNNPTCLDLPAGPGATVSFGLNEEATAVDLVAFQARSGVIYWRTGSETDHLGFNLYRSQTEAGAREPVQAGLIRASGGLRGGEYLVQDAVADGETTWYWLESIDRFGQSEVYSTIDLAVTDAQPTGGNVLTIEAEDNRADFTMPAGVNSVLVIGFDHPPIARDVSQPDRPRLLAGDALETEAGHGVYMSPKTGTVIQVR